MQSPIVYTTDAVVKIACVELAFPDPRVRENMPDEADEEPGAIIVTPDNPAGAINASAAQLAWVSATGARGCSIASAALRLRFAPPTAKTGEAGANALTINADHSVGAGQ